MESRVEVKVKKTLPNSLTRHVSLIWERLEGTGKKDTKRVYCEQYKIDKQYKIDRKVHTQKRKVDRIFVGFWSMS